MLNMGTVTTEFILGIDLGTTNSVLAYAPLDAEHAAGRTAADSATRRRRHGRSRGPCCRRSRIWRIRSEASGGALDLPWAAGRDFAVGEFARRQAAEVPDRTVGAAKSWLAIAASIAISRSCPGARRPSVPKISPVTASQRYLEHLVAAWEAAHPDAPVAEQHRRADRAGLVRRQRPRADARGGAGRRLAARLRAAGRAAGGRLRLAGRSRRTLAANRSRSATRCWSATSAAARPT